MEISGATGMIASMCRREFEYLYAQETPEVVSASRMQLHRAPTDNDRTGYLAIWSALGLDGAFVMVPQVAEESSAASTAVTSNTGVLVEGATQSTKYVRFTRSAQSMEGGANSVQVTCEWSMRPVKAANLMQMHVLHTFASFLRNPDLNEMLIRFDRPEEEAFIHLLGMEYRLGRRTVRVNNQTVVRVWKAWLYLNSTIPSAEALIGGGFGVIDVEKVDDEALKGLPVLPSFDQAQALGVLQVSDDLQVHFAATYTLQRGGQLTMQVRVDAASLHLAPLPRVGLQLNLPMSLQHLRWCGSGPHECYPDRRASGVTAVHAADLLEETLHVPYVRPGENGSRAGVKWAQFHTNQQVSRFDVNGFDKTGADNADNVPSQRVLKVHSKSDFNFSAMHYSTDDLASAMHINDVTAHPRSYLAVNIDPFLMGVGGDDSWSACVHTEDLLQQHSAVGSERQPYSYELSFFLS